ncbi:Peptidase S54 rhomboid [Neofusicoccum parvum]|uniref:Peptidase S54 rhomboid n=2 Tax=Neofusicoccum parvum TaxID=310453 RepID=A0ACB5SM02_9PEZI|nr:putative integral membrane protease of the rhomboid family involved in different forms of regulated intramembrane proteolysis protein [Neofusicoccum parvum UCRNP2]GME38832.1 Peptidase S54 rhomboid [Neofusicoccum parvum]GME47956.1 Peptidase S54 rhomboid [Neofusicoccum parvum]
MLLRPGLLRAARLPPTGALHRAVLARRLYSSWGPSAGQAASERWLYTILGLNTAVFAAWKYADNTIPLDLKASLSPETSRRIAQYVHLDKRQLFNDLYTHFVFKTDDPQRGRWWTTLTAAFSHKDLAHFVFNMFALKSFGEAIIAYCPRMGPSSFLTLYLGAGLAGSLGFYFQRQSQNSKQQSAAIGASGCVSGVAAAVALIAPNAKWQIMFIPIGVPAWLLFSAYLAYDAIYLNDPNSRIGHSGHIGGAAWGAVYYWLVLRRLRSPLSRR